MDKQTQEKIATLVQTTAETVQALQKELEAKELEIQSLKSATANTKVKLEKVASVPDNVVSGIVNMLADTVGFDNQEIKEACTLIKQNPDALLNLVKSAFESKNSTFSEGYGLSFNSNKTKKLDQDGWL